MGRTRDTMTLSEMKRSRNCCYWCCRQPTHQVASVGVSRPHQNCIDTYVMITGRLHCLLVGGAASAKSSFLNTIAATFPRTVCVSGQSTSLAGMLGTMVPSRHDGGHKLYPGAFTRANRGFLLIDDIDYMAPSTREALLMAMEQGTVSVAKAMGNFTLNARVTVIATCTKLELLTVAMRSRFGVVIETGENTIYDERYLHLHVTSDPHEPGIGCL